MDSAVRRQFSCPAFTMRRRFKVDSRIAVEKDASGADSAFVMSASTHVLRLSDRS